MGLFSPLRADENIILLCKKEKVRIGTCLVDRLRCYYRKDCGREYMLMKLICSVSSNLSSYAHEYPDCQEGGNEASLLVSPLVVAGIVIGLVLFLSCVTIIVGSLRKDSRLRNPHLHASYGQWSNFMGNSTYQKLTMALFVVSVWHNDMHNKLICFQKLRGISPSKHSAFVWEFRE
uniref:Brain expressed, associated with NEDD4, 1 n=1 Tax=Cyprinus carpio TaxID=7962 RepID=A0A8C2BYJ8_CYPCA